MTRVLLITDSDRVLRVFLALEEGGVLQLRSASTLALSDEELVQANPEVIFAQSRMSGFSSELALRNLRKGLSPQTRVVLLPVDAADLAQAEKGGKAFLPLTLDDAGLAEGITRMLSPEATAGLGERGKAAPSRNRGSRAKKSPVPAAKEMTAVADPTLSTTSQGGGEAPPARAAKGKARSAGKRKGLEKDVPPLSPEGAEGETPEPSAAEPPAIAGTSAWIAEELPADLPMSDASKAAVDEMAAGVQAVGAQAAWEEAAWEEAAGEQITGEEAAGEQVAGEEVTGEQVAAEQAPTAEKEYSFAEIMRRAAAGEERAAVQETQGAEDAATQSAPVGGPADGARIMVFPGGGEPGDTAEPGPEEIDDALFPVEETTPAEPEAISSAVLRRENRWPRWLIPLIVALVVLPVVYLGARHLRNLQVGKKQETSKPAQLPKAKPTPPVVPSRLPESKPAPQGIQPPNNGTPAPVKPAPRQPAPAKPAPAPPASLAPVPTAKPAVKAGLKALPPFMAGVPVDPAYPKRHPGWQRYLGARGEYKIYRQGDVYRALQIIALPGQSIPDEIYQRSLLEFGGVDSYRIQSTEKKGGFLVEHGEAKGGVGVTVYRKLKDQSLKGLVIFYH